MVQSGLLYTDTAKSPASAKPPTAQVDSVDKPEVVTAEKVPVIAAAPKTFTTRPVSPSQPYAAVTGAKDGTASTAVVSNGPKSTVKADNKEVNYHQVLCLVNALLALANACSFHRTLGPQLGRSGLAYTWLQQQAETSFGNCKYKACRLTLCFNERLEHMQCCI